MKYEFADFRLDAGERRLELRNREIHLEPKAFDVLRCLLQRAGQLVRKDELIESVWEGVAVSDNSLTRCIHQVRGALDDHAEEPKFIETVAGSGYRFIAPVRTAVTTRAQPALRRRLALATAAVALLAVAVIVGIDWQTPPPIERIAVLPLENLTGDPDQAYFVSGIHEAIITELSRIEQVDIISRSSSLAINRGDLSLMDIGSLLDVDAVIEGSVGREADNLTVSVQLVRVNPERHIWAERFHRDVDDVFEITTGIARSVATAMEIELSDSADSMLTRSSKVHPDAYDRYLLASYQLSRQTNRSRQLAVRLFRESIALDPEFANAYVGLANALGSGIVFGMTEPAKAIPAVRQLADTALRNDSTLASAHLLSASLKLYGDWSTAAAEADARSWSNPYSRIRRRLPVADQGLSSVSNSAAVSLLMANSNASRPAPVIDGGSQTPVPK